MAEDVKFHIAVTVTVPDYAKADLSYDIVLSAEIPDDESLLIRYERDLSEADRQRLQKLTADFARLLGAIIFERSDMSNRSRGEEHVTAEPRRRLDRAEVGELTTTTRSTHEEPEES